ncbi:uncharacterized protein LOC132725519 [Ruditapes philippinarum]|uniref:uncharacterized protein LOC132725519 n=1 Tax=Ruditapes philippinarum TaxID=129788 RepID=UPI00295B86D8|nr:uncharacterized protein LOC132725519 [Ruditapes philippinarum]
MLKLLLIIGVVLFVLSGQGSEAADCCGSYTDISGKEHKAELCPDYCCIRLGIEYKECCDDSSRQIPATKNQNEDCVKDWLSQHIWVPIVCGIVGLLIIIGIVVCCCCCCACCKR